MSCESGYSSRECVNVCEGREKESFGVCVCACACIGVTWLENRDLGERKHIDYISGVGALLATEDLL